MKSRPSVQRERLSMRARILAVLIDDASIGLMEPSNRGCRDATMVAKETRDTETVARGASTFRGGSVVAICHSFFKKRLIFDGTGVTAGRSRLKDTTQCQCVIVMENEIEVWGRPDDQCSQNVNTLRQLFIFRLREFIIFSNGVIGPGIERLASAPSFLGLGLSVPSHHTWRFISLFIYKSEFNCHAILS